MWVAKRMKALEVRVGRAAAARLANEGWQSNGIDGLIGASGGPKWLILGHLDRALSRWLHPSRQRPLQAVGSSIGSWRHALLAQRDPIAAIDRFEDVYLRQSYSSTKPSIAEVTAASNTILMTALGDSGATDIVEHPWLHTYIVTAKGRGLTNRGVGSGLILGLGAAALGNAVSRQTLPLSFQRVVFAHAQAQPLPDLLSGFNTCYVPLVEHSVPSALLASGAIPYLFEGVCDVPGGPKGAYWDGGIIDYHFNPQGLRQEGLWLYPHFSNRITHGWFDKFLPWRSGPCSKADQLIMLCPSQEFLASLPFGKIPDRRDFGRMGEVERVRYWRHCVDQSKRLADEFEQLITGDDPLRGVVHI